MLSTLVAAWIIFPSESVEYRAYQDAVGVWTICMGHTRGVHEGMVAGKDECVDYAIKDIQIAQKAVDRCIHHQMTVWQYAAFTDASFNIGPSVVCGSTLQRMANAGDMTGACNQLPRWVYADGRKLRGLVIRRELDRWVCLI